MSTLYVNTIVPNSGSTVNISGSLFVSGTINLGDADTDSVSFGAEISSSIIPDANDTYDLGSAAKSWKTIHGTSSLANTASHADFAATAVTSSHVAANGAAPSQNNITSVGTLTGLTVNGSTIIGSASATHKITGSVDINGSVDVPSGNVHATNFSGSILQAGVTSTAHAAGTITGSGTIKGNKLVSVTNVEAVSFTGSLSGSALEAVTASYATTAVSSTSAVSASYVSGGGVLSGITGLTAGGDLDIGTHAFRAQTLLADGLTSGRVVFAGTNGLLSDDADLTFSSDTLSATKISSSGNIIAASFTGSLSGTASYATTTPSLVIPITTGTSQDLNTLADYSVNGNKVEVKAITAAQIDDGAFATFKLLNTSIAANSVIFGAFTGTHSNTNMSSSIISVATIAANTASVFIHNETGGNIAADTAFTASFVIL